MDQVKEYLRIAVKYRFWILVVIAGLMPAIAYAVGAGGIEEAAKKAGDTVTSSYENVKKYANDPAPVNAQYTPIVDAKTGVLEDDVNASWRTLFSRQAPLLTWPEEVVDRIPAWKREWPEGTDPRVVRKAVLDYIETYDPYIEDVYMTFNPFDYETGEGIVATPEQDALLHPPAFSRNKPPSLGKIWDTQQRLWVQKSVLQVIADINKKAGAQTWAAAPVKELLALEVADQGALDQKSKAEGVAMTEAPDVLSPAEQAAADASEAESESAPGGGQESGQMQQMMRGRGGVAGGSASMGGMMGGGASTRGAPQPFMILGDENTDTSQAFVVPIYLSVYIEQEKINDLLVEFQNSPFNIEVLDVAISKPAPHSVKKPVKGKAPAGMGGMMGGGGSMYAMQSRGSSSSMMEQMMSSGVGSQSMQQMMQSRGSTPSYGMGGSQQAQMRGRSGGTAGMGMGSSAPTKAPLPENKAVDVGQQTLAERIKAQKAAEEKPEDGESVESQTDTTGPDPYYTVVKVDIWGRGRFYMQPPAKESTSQATTGDETEVAATPEFAPVDESDAPEIPDVVETPAEPSEAPGVEPASVAPDASDPTPEAPAAETEPADDAGFPADDAGFPAETEPEAAATPNPEPN